MKPPNRNTERGFTMVEMTVVTAALVPILMAVLGTTKSVQNAVNTSMHLSELSDRVDQVARRFGEMMQTTLGSTIKSRATQPDVDAAIADAIAALPVILPVPLLDDWIVPPENLLRTTLQFYTVSSDLSLIITPPVGPFALEHIMSPGELRNGVDDDGDGLIDEGSIVLRGPSGDMTVMKGVERFQVDVIGSLVVLRFGCAKVDKQGRIHRIYRERRFTIRNK